MFDFQSAMTKTFPLAAAAIFCLTLAGCRGCGAADAPADATTAAATAADAASGTSEAAAAAAAPAKAVPAVLPAVVARVNGDDITRADLERSIRGVENELNQRVPADKRDGVIRGVLDRVINYRLLLQEARARGIEVAPAEVDAQMTALARRFESADAMRQALIVRGVNIEMLRDDARRDLRVGKLVADETGRDVTVPDEDVRRFYDQNLERFREPDAARASHIFVRVAADADEKAQNALRQRAESLMRLAKRGDDFAELAGKYSEDRATGQRGGDLGWFAKGQTPKAFDEAVFALQPNEIGGLVKTNDGYHIVKVHERRASRVQPFTDVASDIAGVLLRQKQEALTASLINQLRAKATIDILF